MDCYFNLGGNFMKAVDLLKKCIEQLEQMSQEEFDKKVIKVEKECIKYGEK